MYRSVGGASIYVPTKVEQGFSHEKNVYYK
jgi:hypothetical protein